MTDRSGSPRWSRSLVTRDGSSEASLDTTAREVTAQINHAREMLALAESQVATLTALRNEMRSAKAHTVGELPAEVRARHRGAISACAGVPGGVELW
jgi:hypothetical protein